MLGGGRVKKHESTIKLYYRLYDFLIAGKTQTYICKVLRRDKAQISRMTKALEQGGWINCDRHFQRTKIYTATKKQFNIKTLKEVYKLTTSRSQRLHRRCQIIQIQKSSFICDVIHPPNSKMFWDKEWEHNGLHHTLIEWPFANIGSVKFDRMTSQKTDQLRIILPRLLWEKDNDNPQTYLLEIADKCATWFMKKSGIRLDNLHICQKPDYALVLTDKKLIGMAQQGTFRAGDIMIDSSAPDELPEIESKDWDVISGLASAPDDIRMLKEEISEIKSMITEMRSEFHELMRIPKTPDSFIEVA